MKKCVILMVFAAITVGAAADVSNRTSDGKRLYYQGDLIKPASLAVGYDIPCDTVEGTLLSANLTPVAVQLTPVVNRKWTIYNAGGGVLKYRTAQWGLPPDWATVYVGVAAGASKDVDLSGIQQLWVWHSEATTPVPSASGCFSINALAYVPTLTATPTATPTISQTFTPTYTQTFTPTVTPTATPTPTP